MKEYKYYMNHRPLSLGTTPKDFSRFDEEDKGGRYGAIYYERPLTEQEIADYELEPADTSEEKAVSLHDELKEMEDDQLAKILLDYKKRQNVERGESGELDRLLEKHRPIYGMDVYRVAEALLLKTVTDRWLQQYKNKG